MISQIAKKVFGTRNEREVKRLAPIIQHINSLEPGLKTLSDEQLAKKTVEFRERLSKGETLDDLMPEAFAVEIGRASCRERVSSPV